MSQRTKRTLRYVGAQVTVNRDVPGAAEDEAVHCVGKFFDTDGYFWEQGLINAVCDQLKRVDAKKAD